MNRTIWLLGDGVLMAAVRERLCDAWSLRPLSSAQELADAIQACGGEAPLAVISVHDRRATALELEVNEIARAAGLPYLRVNAYGDTACLGPWSMPAASGCVACAETRMRTVHPLRKLGAVVQQAEADERYARADKPWTVALLETAGLVVASELERLQTAERLQLQSSVYIVRDHVVEGRLHPFVNVPSCPTCGVLPEDAPELADLKLVPRLKPDPYRYRLPNPHLTLREMKERFLDPLTGIMKFLHPFHYYDAPNFVPSTMTEMPLLGDEMSTVYGCGRADTYEACDITGILEALERYAGTMMRGRRASVHGSYAELKERAVDPRLFGLYDEALRSEPGHAMVPYHDDLSYDWIWAWSWKRQEPVLIPRQLAFYHEPDQQNIFLRESSNGCGMGGSMEEAIFHALSEWIERDSFLVAWYNRLPLTRLSLEGVRDRNLLLICDRMEAFGYEMRFYDMTMDSGMPAIIGLLLNHTDDGGFKICLSAGAHIDPETAIAGALFEVSATAIQMGIVVPQNKDEVQAVWEDPSRVQGMDDHILRLGHPDAPEMFDFILKAEGEPKDVREVFASWYSQEPPQDLTEELKGIVERILQHHPDLIVADQTTPELSEIGVHAVKVLVPGMLSMTFGHQYRRPLLERIQYAPVWAGRREEPISPDEINLLPHPFP
jgi:ribosomal protein S12 methylthiotransferase accessory factor